MSSLQEADHAFLAVLSLQESSIGLVINCTTCGGAAPITICISDQNGNLEKPMARHASCSFFQWFPHLLLHPNIMALVPSLSSLPALTGSSTMLSQVPPPSQVKKAHKRGAEYTNWQQCLPLAHHNPHNATEKLVAKLYWPEEKVYNIMETDKRVKYHVPEMVWFHKFEDTSTIKIRSALGLEGPKLGRHVFYIIIFRRLEPITDTNNKLFLITWWHAIICHYALWEGFVHHHDVSPNNFK
ncbi:hypothetical protein BDR05DRAFT_1005703 [Suillus weaverae]|nr:hypothetical protein BDR05DRAFT_1005703 [Suillus weaverae]